MKKLMMIAAVAFACVGVRAASVNWDVSIAEFDSDWNSGVYSLVIADNASGSWDFTANDAGSVTGSIVGDTEGNFAAGTPWTATMTATLDDGNQYTKVYNFVFPSVSDGGPADQSLLSDLNGEIAAAFIDQDLGTFPYAADAASQGWTPASTPGPGPGPSGVPEPTSGLLLLVGGAMLGLRRKRA